MVLSIRNLRKRFGSFEAVRDVSFEIAAGEVIALLGASGSGKTTTLRMINRLIEPTSGAVLLDGVKADEMPAHEWRRRIGYVIQGAGLFPHMSLVDNVSVTPRLLGWPEAECRERASELLDLVGLSSIEYADRLPSEISGGQQQRVGFARALAGKPDVILMDEPFGALDALTKDTLLEDFVRLQKELGFAVVLVTHDLSEAVRLADRIAVLDGGEIVQLADPRELVVKPGTEEVAVMLDAARRHAAHIDALFTEGTQR